MDRLVDRYERWRLGEIPIAVHQHALQTGRSMEITHHELIYKTERALEDGLVTLGTFPDTAHLTTVSESMHKAAEEQRVEQNVVRWVPPYLQVGR
jgi:hypothetical protein